MKRTGILFILAWISATLCAQHVTPWGISPMAVPPNVQSGATQVSSLSTGGIVSTRSSSDLITLGLQQTGLDVYIPVWDTLDIEELLDYSVGTSEEIHFFLEADALGPDAQFSIATDGKIGEYSWDPEHQLFSFTHDPELVDFCDTVVFKAFSGSDTIQTNIAFTYVPDLPPEDNAMGLNEVSTQEEYLMSDVLSNVDSRDSSLHIAGRILLFDREKDDHGICDYSAILQNDARFDTIKQVFLYADSLVIAEPMWFPGVDVTIYARKLVFQGPQAAINTSPFDFTEVSKEENGSTGRNAGNVRLYVGDIKMGPGSHFILNGGMGESVVVEPDTLFAGNGGNGGILESPLFIPRVNYTLQGGRPGTGGAVYATNGEAGSIVKTAWYPSVWLHARILQPEIVHLRLQYMENNLNYVRQRCSYLDGLLAEKFSASDTAATVDDADMMNVQNEIIELQNRLQNNLDYFGNPVGWVPLLSFEIYKEAFNQEVDHAFNLMFLGYLINKADANIVQAKQGMTNARTGLIDEVEELQDQLNTNIGRLSSFEIEYEAARVLAENLKEELEKMQERLLKEAKDKADKAERIAKIKSVASVGGQILSCIPHPACQIAGTALTTASQINYEDPWTLDNATVLATGAYEGYKSYKAVSASKLGDKTKIANQTGISDAETSNSKAGLSKWNKASSVLKDMAMVAKDYDYSCLQLKTPDAKVQAELDKLMAASSEYKNLLKKVEAAILDKQRLHSEIEITMNNINSALNRTAENRMAIQSLTASIQDANGQRDIRSMQYANNLEKRSFERLKKYHYMMTRAYEYRTLRPWTEPLDMEEIRNKLFNYVSTLAPDAEAVLPQEQLDIIKTIYQDQLQVIAEKILDEIEAEGFTRNLTITFELKKEELEALNKDEELYINPFEMNLFGLDRENVRIMDIGVVECELEDGSIVDGTLKSLDKNTLAPGASAIEIRFEHSGFSKLLSNGNIYYFNHNRLGVNHHKWTSSMDITGGKITQEGISPSMESMLRSLLGGLSDNNKLVFCSEPSAWANIGMRRVSGTETRDITSMKIEINYDFKYVKDEYKLLKVETDGDVAPTYLLSSKDVNDLKDGKGAFFRTYSKNTPVVLTAQEQFGQQKFIRWDEIPYGVGGRSEFSRDVTIGLAMSEHRHLIAVYGAVDSVWLKTPLENQVFKPGEALMITWEQNMDHDMRLDLYADGFYAATICDSIMGTSYSWNIPADLTLPADGTCQVKITSRLDHTLFDWSDNLQFQPTSVEGALTGHGSNGLRIYPNPADAFLWLGFAPSLEIDRASWSILTMDGRTLQKGILVFGGDPKEQAIWLGEVPAGSYLVNVQTEKGGYTRKFTKR